MHDPALDLVELGRHRVDLHAELRRRLVDEVDGLVREEAVGDVAVGQHGRSDQRCILELDAVVRFVPLAKPTQDADRVFDRRFADEHRLKAPLQGGVLLDVLAVLVQRRGADRVQLPARQHRLEHVGGVHRPF